MNTYERGEYFLKRLIRISNKMATIVDSKELTQEIKERHINYYFKKFEDLRIKFNNVRKECSKTKSLKLYEKSLESGYYTRTESGCRERTNIQDLTKEIVLERVWY